jgi:hypothetical protein
MGDELREQVQSYIYLTFDTVLLTLTLIFHIAFSMSWLLVCDFSVLWSTIKLIERSPI